MAVRAERKRRGIVATFKCVDTCAAEFATNTAYMYSTYDEECESNPTDKKNWSAQPNIRNAYRTLVPLSPVLNANR